MPPSARWERIRYRPSTRRPTRGSARLEVTRAILRKDARAAGTRRPPTVGGRPCWQTGAVSENTPTDPSETDLESLVGDWLTVPDVAERLGVPLSRVRQWLADRELLGSRIGERNGWTTTSHHRDDGQTMFISLSTRVPVTISER